MPAATQTTVPPISVPATYIRGGTSKAVFFHEKDIPAQGKLRDAFLLGVMGSPDPMQINGMGGSHVVTSKVAIIRPSTRPDADVDYTFAQVGLKDAKVSYDGNCGNISAGVGPFAINERLLKTEDWDGDRRVVRIWNTGMEIMLVAYVPVIKKTERALEKGDFFMSGCPTPGAPILMDYSKTANPQTMLPTGNVTDELDCTFGRVPVTYCSVGNSILFANAEHLGIRGDETVAELDDNHNLIAKVKEIRGRICKLMGRCDGWQKVDEQSPMMPMVALVSKSTSKEGHIQSRLFLDNHCHPSVAGTGAVCTTACSRIEGSIVNEVFTPEALQCKETVIQHPAGHLPIQTETEAVKSEHGYPSFKSLGFTRTSRYIMQGQVFVPEELQERWTSIGQDEEKVHEGDLSVNGLTNGHTTNGETKTNGHSERPQEVTKKLAKFVHETSFTDLGAVEVQRLRQYLLDFLGVAALGADQAESSEPFLKSIDALAAGSIGTATVIAKGKRFPRQYAALLNGTYAHSLDFDDTHMGGVIHIGTSVIAAVLAEIEDGDDVSLSELLLAVAAGYEVCCRIAMACGVSSWKRGFHNTGICGIFGAVAAISKLRRLDATTIENAFGIAVSFASGSMQYLENGSYNKRVHPGWAAHNAFVAVQMAQTGVIGAAQPIEGKFGFIRTYTDTPNAKVDVSNLGRTWKFTDTALKPFPACRLTHGQIEIAGKLSEAGGRQGVKNIHIIMDTAGYPVVGVPHPNKVHPGNVVDAQFSVHYQTAATWLYGAEQGWSIYDHLNDDAVHELSKRITVEHNDLSKQTETTVEVTWDSGEKKSMHVVDALWEQPTRPPRDEEVISKFRALTEDLMGGKKGEKVIATVLGDETASVNALLQLLV